jgi:predicted DNA-binding ribbon-helix-helix protein
MKQHNEQVSGKDKKIKVERVQTGIRMEKRMVKVLKAMAEYHDISLGVLLERIVLHSFENKPLFSEKNLEKVKAIKEVYDMDYGLEISRQWNDSEN